MISFEEARKIVNATLAERCVDTETISVGKQPWACISNTVASKLDLPPFDKSIMDGYAVMER